MEKNELECGIDGMMYILLVTTTVMQNMINKNEVITCSRKFILLDFIMLFVMQLSFL